MGFNSGFKGLNKTRYILLKNLTRNSTRIFETYENNSKKYFYRRRWSSCEQGKVKRGFFYDTENPLEFHIFQTLYITIVLKNNCVQ